ncbi:hypothetical protein QL374_004856 [Salmonella enterica]|nr:hypothetical protein [Salmonella enterica]ELW6564434.1 hypothetical protein [Salmonella enterica]ELZ1404326.1 hypothetical protein [Salmonella enterica]
MNKESLSWWLSLLFSGIVSYCFWLQMSPGRGQKYLFPETIIVAMLSFTAVFGAVLHMQQYSDRFIAPVFLVLSVLFSLLFVVYIWGLIMVFIHRLKQVFFV